MALSEDPLVLIDRWLHNYPGVFSNQRSDDHIELIELFSKKYLRIKRSDIAAFELRKNALQENESYVIVLLNHGKQLILCKQGFAFAPDFTNTGDLQLPNQVYCMRDFYYLFESANALLVHHDRRREILDVLMSLIAILDGARGVGLEIGTEEQTLQRLLNQLESGQI